MARPVRPVAALVAPLNNEGGWFDELEGHFLEIIRGENGELIPLPPDPAVANAAANQVAGQQQGNQGQQQS